MVGHTGVVARRFSSSAAMALAAMLVAALSACGSSSDAPNATRVLSLIHI